MKISTKSGGRPRQEEAAQLSGKILDVAQSLFLAQGFERTSIDRIANTAHVAKRTLYARFADKEAIFDAVIKRRIDQNLLEIDSLELQGFTLEDKLMKLAHLLLEHVLQPEALELDRAITAEAVRFPNLARLYREHAAPRYMEYVARMLISSPGYYSGERQQADRDANNFLVLMVLPLLRTALFSTPDQVRRELEGGIIEDRIRFFMNGIRP
ncbi:TetR/AcrR family transcriptional regulator (plasmid) [Agrobacterium rosae]|uniref:TetR/AcrR family transcriptional regulator n=2 Tax=Agrobacterium TaxID=357 RepID=A0AAE5RTT1_9HYPH|nr:MULTISPECIES: TetR/AcrR family transcriptional regulator [Agrobacterium]KAA3509132.1 TetR/AcrR family transcriptional regulator [Agrobacterium rosae]KAA3513827.1 TetR/AcrR family transcriptional regulator [Agrobacterium rosae]MBO0131958.1 TetR/AcrR family transcriptional regulator [Agrobacterium burrii]MCM2435698.1 TetR/AcrR family transcriptional regulator [Agrobacterium rosae]MDX8316460.1 TetR/AcrR family transcriptional regulator [Agrobacterium rosae]